MDYQQSVDWLYDRLPAYQNIGEKALKIGLANIVELSEIFGNPQNNFKSIHIAGTNGKGSTSSLMASALMENGYKVGLTVSPHLLDIRERLMVNGEFCKEEFVIDFVTRVKNELDYTKFSFFEVMIAMAFAYFDAMKVDFAVVETGMGGRLDSTNILLPILSVITNVSLDHTAFLGDARDKIAYEKAGIIKENTSVIVGEKDEQTAAVYAKVAKERNAKLFFVEDLEQIELGLDLNSGFLYKNAQLAWHALHTVSNIKLNEDKTKIGFRNYRKKTNLRARWEQVQTNPKVMVDVGHNPAAFVELNKLFTQFCEGELHMVLGFVKDKDIKSILDLLPKNAKYYFSQPNIERAMPIDILRELVGNRFENSSYFPYVKQAYKNALMNAKDKDMVFVGGSTFVVSDFLTTHKS